MQKLKNALHNRRGETIVEVLVAFVLLMLFLAMFTASLRYARRASDVAQTTRDTAYTLTGGLYPVNDDAVQWQPGTPAEMDFSRGGGRATFVVKNVQQQTYTVTADDGTSHTFTRYYKEDTTP